MRLGKLISFAIMSSLFCGHLYAQSIITEQEAIDSGMTLVTPNGQLLGSSLSKSPIKTSITEQDLNLAEYTIVVNKGIRTRKNPEGQTVTVYHNGVFLTSYLASTGTEKEKITTAGNKYIATTPTGYFRIKKAYREYESFTFKGAPMTYALFFNGGIAIHSTSRSHYAELGMRASGGCVRLRLEQAQELNEMVRSTGDGTTRLLDEGFEGLARMRYLDRIYLPDISQYSGVLKDNQDDIYTYDAVIIVVDPPQNA